MSVFMNDIPICPVCPVPWENRSCGRSPSALQGMLLTALSGPQYSMHCCVLGFLSCSVFLHMSFELKLLLLLLWLVASSSLFLHSYAWLSDCLIAQLYQSPLDSR